MTRVLLTGAGGFVGSHVLEVLLTDTDWEIVVVDSFRHNGASDLIGEAMVGAGDTSRTQVFMHDLAAPVSPRQLARIGKLDYIIHVASRCSVTESIDHPADFVRNNIDSTLTVLELARQQWCWQTSDPKLFDHRLVLLSTDEVYGSGAIREYTDHRPSSPYAASKAAQEDLVHAWQRTYGFPATIFNSANMFGERQSLLAFIPKVIGAILSHLTVPIHTFHDAPGRRHYTYVRNTAQAIVDHLAAARQGGAIFPQTRPLRVALAGQHQIDNLALAQQIAGLIGRPLRYSLVDGAAVRPGYDGEYSPLGADGWAQISFTEGLERTVKWYVDNPEWLR